MTAKATPQRLLLGQPPERVAARAAELFRASPFRYPEEPDSAVLERLLSGIVESIGEALTPTAVADQPLAELRPGSALGREPEKSAALLGAVLASGSGSGFDVTALSFAIRDALVELGTDGQERRRLQEFGEWLAAVAMDSFASARAAAEREQARENLENGLPVVLITPEVPAAFLVGRLDGDLVDSALSRLLLLVVRVGARTAIVDASGLCASERPEVVQAFADFAEHRKVKGKVVVVVVGLSAESEQVWGQTLASQGITAVFESHFDRAVSDALSLAGYRLLRQ